MRRFAGGGLKALGLLLLAASPLLAYLGGGESFPFPVRFLLGLPHALAYGFLLWLFGRTLLAGRQPLITSVARRVHGTLKPEIEAYTRGVTLAWCLFFIGQLVVSALLFALAPADIWLLFVGLLNVPLLAIMFLGEYLCRVIRHPHHPRTSIARSARAFVENASVSVNVRAR